MPSDLATVFVASGSFVCLWAASYTGGILWETVVQLLDSTVHNIYSSLENILAMHLQDKEIC